MVRHSIPTLTMVLVVMLAGLHWLVPEKTLLYFNAADIGRGEAWRMISGHLVHADWQHLWWNCLALAVLGAVLERHSRPLLWVSLGVGVTAVSALLLSPLSQLDNYCGLSGVLNTLLVAVLWSEWRRTGSWLIVLIGCGTLAKVLLEVSQGVAIMTNISWPPYAWSHVAGLAGGLLVVWFQHQRFPATGPPMPAPTDGSATLCDLARVDRPE